MLKDALRGKSVLSVIYQKCYKVKIKSSKYGNIKIDFHVSV